MTYDFLRCLHECRIINILIHGIISTIVYYSYIAAKLELKMSGHCVSSWSDHMISKAIGSTIPLDAADVDPRQYTSWLDERSASGSSVTVDIPGTIFNTYTYTFIFVSTFFHCLNIK